MDASDLIAHIESFMDFDVDEFSRMPREVRSEMLREWAAEWGWHPEEVQDAHRDLLNMH